MIRRRGSHCLLQLRFQEGFAKGAWSTKQWRQQQHQQQRRQLAGVPPPLFHAESVLTPFERARQVTASVNVETEKKRLVRPDWDLCRWSHDHLSSRAWPQRRPEASEQVSRFPISSVAASGLDPSKPAVILGVTEEWPAHGCSS